MSVKISSKGRYVGKLNGGYGSYSEEKQVKDGASIDHAVNQDLEMTKVNGFEKMDGVEKMKEGGTEHEALDAWSLQWGQRKRTRCSRIELKQATDESSLLLKKSIRVVKAEKQLLLGETTNTIMRSRSQTLRHTAASPAREVGSSSGRRNGFEFSLSLRGNSIGRQKHMPNDSRHSLSNMAERPDRHTPSPYRNGIISTCPQSTQSPENRFTVLTLTPEGDNLQNIPSACKKVDLDMFDWPRIIISLSRKEKEDDFMAIKGCKLPQRPKKRPKVVEKTLHYCSPGNWLSDLTKGRYDVREKKCSRKKPRGLKAMESSDNDSD